MMKLGFKFVISCNKLLTKNFVFAYSNNRRNSHWNQYAWM